MIVVCKIGQLKPWQGYNWFVHVPLPHPLRSGVDNERYAAFVLIALLPEEDRRGECMIIHTWITSCYVLETGNKATQSFLKGSMKTFAMANVPLLVHFDNHDNPLNSRWGWEGPYTKCFHWPQVVCLLVPWSGLPAPVTVPQRRAAWGKGKDACGNGIFSCFLYEQFAHNRTYIQYIFTYTYFVILCMILHIYCRYKG